MPRLFTLPMLIAAFFLFQGSTWEQVSSDEESPIIEVKEDSRFRMQVLRAKKILNGSPEAVLSALSRTQSIGTGVERQTIIAYSSDDHLVLTKVELPWPLKDRHFITRNTTIRDSADYIRVISKSVAHQLPEQLESTLGSVHFSEFILKRTGLNSTEVEMTFNVDPNGSLPSFLINRLQRHKPVEFFSDLERSLAEIHAANLAQ